MSIWGIYQPRALSPRQNRRKTGELFVNLLDMRGLCVAKDAETGEDIWYLVGIWTEWTAMYLGVGARIFDGGPIRR